VNTVGVASVDKAVKKFIAAGGKALRPKIAIPTRAGRVPIPWPARACSTTTSAPAPLPVSPQIELRERGRQLAFRVHHLRPRDQVEAGHKELFCQIIGAPDWPSSPCKPSVSGLWAIRRFSAHTAFSRAVPSSLNVNPMHRLVAEVTHVQVPELVKLGAVGPVLGVLVVREKRCEDVRIVQGIRDRNRSSRSVSPRYYFSFSFHS
jgi:hypothetical protein